MTLLPPPAGPLSVPLCDVARDLARLIDRITEAALAARGLAEAVDWQAEAATAFHDRAALWAGEVSGLGCLAETTRHDVVRAQDRAAFAAAFPGLFPGAHR